ncbi:calcineurin-like phosphoesterase C-terminal domain-containing protein [Arcticibacter tournemirensis]
MLKRICLLFIVALFASACKKNNDKNQDNPDTGIAVKAGMDLVGKVMAGTVPLNGVVVSDGYSVVRTDANGVYQMKRNAGARFVFISVPAECKVPVKENNKVAFYQALDQSQKVIYANFSLTVGEKETDFKLIAVADPQFSTEFEYNRFSNETVPDLLQTQKVLEASGKPVYGVVLGDFVWDQMSMFSRFGYEFSRFSFPFFTVIGNHDYNMSIKNDDIKAAANYEQNFGPTYYSFNRGECHFVILDDIEYSGSGESGKGYKTNVSQEQLAWLEKDLYFVPKDKLIIVCLHVNTKTRFTETSISNNDALYKLLNGYQVRILSGHTHWHGNVSIGTNITEHIHGAACGAFWSGSINRDGSPNGYAVYEVGGNKVINHYFKATGFNKDYQIKLYPINSWALRKNDVIANIWDWHTDWKSVKVYENGVLKGDMPQFEEKNAKDPYAKWLLDISGSIINDAAADAVITDHLFYYRPQSADAMIKVVATDSYGNEYTSEIKANAALDFPGPV